MRKKVYYFLLALLCLFAFSGIVRAENEKDEGNLLDRYQKCTTSVKSHVLSKASEVKISYETVEYKSEKAPNIIFYYVDIYIYNLDESLYVTVQNGKTGKSFDVTSKQANPNGVIKLRQKDTSSIVNYTFEIKANTLSCYQDTVRTIRLTVPKYNNLSERAVCADIPDYYMCQRFVNYDIDASKFLDSVTRYKESLEEEETKKIEKGETGIVTAATKTISKHKNLVIGLVLIIGAVVTVLVLKKRRSVL